MRLRPGPLGRRAGAPPTAGNSSAREPGRRGVRGRPRPMQADPTASTPSANGAGSASEMDALATMCGRQAQEIHSLDDTIAIFRKGMSSLTVENARLRSELASVQDERA